MLNFRILYGVMCLLIIGCKEQSTSTKHDELKEIKVESTLSEKGYTPDNQSIEEVSSGDFVKYTFQQTETSFNVSQNRIELAIYVPDEKMRIKNAFNVSHYSDTKKFNAIVLHLSNGSELTTGDEVNHVLRSELEISKIKGLSEEYLQQDGKLKVYLINSVSLSEEEKNAFVNCASQEVDYSTVACDPVDGGILDKAFRPKEIKGDIIMGG